MIGYRMPFGKYRGIPVNELPMDYLQWLVGNVELRDPLKRYVFARLRSDQPTGTTETHPGINFGALRRKFATKYHPDVAGGSKVAMTVVNDIFDHFDQITKQNSHRG